MFKKNVNYIIIAACLSMSQLLCAQDVTEQIKQFLSSPGAVEQFRTEKSKQSKEQAEQDSPLVKEARSFALYLDPPPPPPPPPSVNNDGQPTVVVKPKALSVTFTLTATCYSSIDPNLSLALLDEPGKGCRWVRQSGKIGRLSVEQIKDGAIVVTDGQTSTELFSKKIERVSLLKNKPNSGIANRGSDTISTTEILPPDAAAAVPAPLASPAGEIPVQLPPPAPDPNVANPIVETPATPMSKEEEERALKELEDFARAATEANSLGDVNGVNKDPNHVNDPNKAKDSNSAKDSGKVKDSNAVKDSGKVKDSNPARVTPNEARRLKKLGRALQTRPRTPR